MFVLDRCTMYKVNDYNIVFSLEICKAFFLNFFFCFMFCRRISTFVLFPTFRIGRTTINYKKNVLNALRYHNINIYYDKIIFQFQSFSVDIVSSWNNINFFEENTDQLVFPNLLTNKKLCFNYNYKQTFARVN